MKKIYLGGKAGNGIYAIVDNEDFEMLSDYSWHLSGNGYARTSWREDGARKDKYMHRFLIEIKDGLVTDHINRNKLDNRKSNLRAVDKSQNARNVEESLKNKNGYPGLKKHGNKYRVQISYLGNKFYLGLYSTKLEAAKVYDGALQLIRFNHAINVNLEETLRMIKR